MTMNFDVPDCQIGPNYLRTTTICSNSFFQKGPIVLSVSWLWYCLQNWLWGQLACCSEGTVTPFPGLQGI